MDLAGDQRPDHSTGRLLAVHVLDDRLVPRLLRPGRLRHLGFGIGRWPAGLVGPRLVGDVGVGVEFRSGLRLPRCAGDIEDRLELHVLEHLARVREDRLVEVAPIDDRHAARVQEFITGDRMEATPPTGPDLAGPGPTIERIQLVRKDVLEGLDVLEWQLGERPDDRRHDAIVVAFVAPVELVEQAPECGVVHLRRHRVVGVAKFASEPPPQPQRAGRGQGRPDDQQDRHHDQDQLDVGEALLDRAGTQAVGDATELRAEGLETSRSCRRAPPGCCRGPWR